jgi:hypothetical protein
MDIENRVPDYKFQKSIGVSILNTGTELLEHQISYTEKSIGYPALVKPEVKKRNFPREYLKNLNMMADLSLGLNYSLK